MTERPFPGDLASRIPPYLALIPVCAGVFIAADDQTVIVTVLPRMMLDLGVQVNELDNAAWTITGYLLGYVAAMPLIGRISDVWGHKRLFIASMALFMAGSVGSAMAGGLWWLVFARVIQAIGAGALVPISIAIVGDLFLPGKRGIPLGLVGAAAEAGGVIGPLWGGLFVRFLDWRWVFWINIPLGAVVILGIAVMLVRSPRYRQSIDYLGGGLIAVSLSTLTLGLARIGTPDALMAVYLAAAVATLGLFVARQASVTEPLLALAMFRIQSFSAANATHVLVGGALIIGMVTVPLMANTVQGQTALEGGLRLMRMTAAIGVGALIGGFMCQRFDYRIPALAGLALSAAGYVLMSRWELDVGQAAMTAHLVITGLGFGLLIAPIALSATNSVGAGHRGTAAAMVTAMRMLGMTTGLAGVAAWGSGRFTALAVGIPLPLPQSGDTEEQIQARVETFDIELVEVGLSLFSDFFLIAAVLCILAIVPAVFMAWDRSRTPDESSGIG